MARNRFGTACSVGNRDLSGDADGRDAALKMLEQRRIAAEQRGAASKVVSHATRALINSTGQVAGFVSPYLVGWIKDTTGGTEYALYVLALAMVTGMVLVLRIPAQTANR